MPPKHSVGALKEEEQLAKRPKNSETPTTRSETPIDLSVRVPFEIRYPPMRKKKLSRREQELVNHAEYTISPFIAKGALKRGELNQYYTVVPCREWESMRKYSNFVIQGEMYRNNQFVFVRGETTPRGGAVEDPKDFWVARILQVRAESEKHVYALVAWMYWPDELPPPKKPAPDQVSPQSGRRTYHGSHELIASSYLDVLDVLSFAGKADIGHWLEEDDNLMHKLYWRQTFCRETQELSKLREHCVCDGYFNPEVAMEICENPDCKVWLHEQCVIDDALTKTHKRLVEDNSSVEPDADGTKMSGKKPKIGHKVWGGIFVGKLNPADDSGPTTMTITDLRSDGQGTWTERIPCPACGTLLE